MTVLRNHRLHALAAAIVAIAALALVIPSLASAADCQPADLSYNGACGPQFELPAWGDGGGWTDPSQYSTIQLADLTGSGVDDLIARGSDGIEIWYFDTAVGQWRPAIGESGNPAVLTPEVLTDFASSSATQKGPNWQQPQYYSTIQTADLDGPGKGADIIARFPSGIRVYHYTPPAGSKSINGGTWSVVSQNGPFSDADGFDSPGQYLSIHAIGASGGHPGSVEALTADNHLLVYDWTGSGWVKQIDSGKLNSGLNFDLNDPQYVDDVRAQTVSLNGASVPAYFVRTPFFGEIGIYPTSSNGPDHGYLPDNLQGPFSDDSPGCTDCFGASPSYYDTLGFASNFDGSHTTDMFGRLADGLHVYKLTGTSWTQLPTLTDLSGTAQQLANQPGRWASIRAGDILGNGQDQVLALDGSQLAAWSYDATKRSWTKLSADQPLDLGGDMWAKDPQYYSTIQVGDVTGPDGPDAVIARGPYGIRTWFYCQAGETTAPCGNLGGKSGWTSWQPQGTSSYPQFTDNGTSDGETYAFAALNYLAHHYSWIPDQDSTVRDVWTAETAPNDDTLNQLAANIEDKAGCTGNPPSGSPPPFAQCTALPAPSDQPTGNGPFTVNDWTTVVNEILEEIKEAKDANAWFDTMSTMNMNTFIRERNTLDAIISDLSLQAAASNEETISGAEIASSVMDILGELVYEIPVAGEYLAAPLELAGVVTGMLASESPTLNSKFPASVVQLNAKFATMVSEIITGLGEQSLEVRSNYGLLTTLSQLTTGAGPWTTVNTDAMQSANDEGFAVWAYQTLLPSLYERYSVYGCGTLPPGQGAECSTNYQRERDGHTLGTTDECPPGLTQDSQHPCLTMIGPPRSNDGHFDSGYPCHSGLYPGCKFDQLADINMSLATTLWGPLDGVDSDGTSRTCDYVPGQPTTQWRFGCNLGIPAQNTSSVTNGAATGWDFFNSCWDGLDYNSQYYADIHNCDDTSSQVTVGHNGSVTLSGHIALPAGFHVESATIPRDGLLYEPAGQPGVAADVAERAPDQPLGAIRVEAAGATPEPTGAGRVRALLKLGSAHNGVRSYKLTVGGVDVNAPNPCEALPASVAPRDQTVVLTSTVLLKDGSKKQVVSLSGVWRCVRDKAGNVSRLVRVPPPPVVQRPGLAASVSGPKTVLAGSTATFTIKVHNNRRRTSNAIVSSLWHLGIAGAAGAIPVGKTSAVHLTKQQAWQVTRLRQGTTRVLHITAQAPDIPGTQLCAGTQVTADSARAAGAHVCADVIATPTPTFTG